MSNDIKILGYRALIPNSTYGKKAKRLINQLARKETPSTEIIQLFKFTYPRVEDIIRAIQKEICDCNLRYHPEDAGKEVAGIIMDDKKVTLEDMMDYVKQFVPTPYRYGETYLEVINGTLTNEILECNKEEIKVKGNVAYGRLLHHTTKLNHLLISIRLNEWYSLPDRSEIESNLKRGVGCCDLFFINGSLDENTVNKIRLVYSAINPSEKIKKIENVSSRMLSLYAAIILSHMFQNLNKNEFNSQTNPFMN